MSPLILALVQVGLVFARSHNERISPVVSRLALAGGVGVLTWMAVRPAVISPRYILATLLLFAPVGGWAAETIFRRVRNSRLLKATAFSALCYAAALPNLDHAAFFTTLSAGGLGRGNCVGSAACRGLEYLDKVAAKGDRVYLLGFYAYHLRPDLLQCLNSIDDVMPEMANADTVWETLVDRGFTYIVLQKASHATAAPWLSVDRAPRWLNVRVLYDDPSTRVFALRTIDDLHRPMVKCVQEPAPAWSVVPSR